MNDQHKILIVDDSKTILQMLKLGLERTGEHVVKTAISLDEAWRILKSSCIDLVVSDILLRSSHAETGYHLLRRIKESPTLKHVRVIMMSGMRKEKRARATVKRMGGDDFLKKPFETAILVKKIRQLLKYL